MITALVVSLAAALAATSALAGPQVGRCVSQPGTGKYKNSGCTQKAGAKPEEKSFEFLKNAIHKGFTLAGGVESFEGERGEQVFCAHESGSGEYLESGSTPSTKQVHHVVGTLTECELENKVGGSNAICNSPGQTAGTIVTASLAGKMNYWVQEGLKLFGQELHPEAKNAAYTSIECSGGQRFAFAPGHCVIAVLGPANLMEQYFEWTFETKREVGGEVIQLPESFANSPHICHLEWSVNGEPMEEVVHRGGDTIKNEEALEIKG
jgi:hypothetical protein